MAQVSTGRKTTTRRSRETNKRALPDRPGQHRQWNAINAYSDRSTQSPLAQGLGWFSVGLGLAELLAPRQVARLIGVREDPETCMLLRFLGIRELASGVGIFMSRRPVGWLWSRVAGDIMDLTLLGRAFDSAHSDKNRLVFATASVVGVSILDLYSSISLSTNQQEQWSPARRYNMHVKRSITVNLPVEEVYAFWHNFENFPRFMKHLESVQVTGSGRSHWKAHAPAGTTVEWEAEITEDVPNQSISWRSVEGSEIKNAGSVRFAPAPGDRGTEVRVELHYDAPGGILGTAIAKLFGEEPGQQVQSDLRSFKQVMETGEVVISEGTLQSKGLIQRAAQPMAASKSSASY